MSRPMPLIPNPPSDTTSRYRSEKVEASEDSWRHVKVTPEPLNREFQPIILTVEDEGTVRVAAELVEVPG